MNASSLVNIASGLQPLEKIPLWLRGPCSKTVVQFWQGSWTETSVGKRQSCVNWCIASPFISAMRVNGLGVGFFPISLYLQQPDVMQVLAMEQ